MSNVINVYCDESCHLENDGIPIMILGAIWCKKSKIKEISQRLRSIKKRHNLNPFFEIKWNKISPSEELFYQDVVNYFFDDDDLHFRAVIAPKDNLDHKSFDNTHDSWYYKMYFNLLKVVIDPSEDSYNIYIDIKDTLGTKKVEKLHEVLCSSNFDFSKSLIKKVQQIRSHESELLQLSDLIAGAIGYENRNLKSSQAKLNIIKLIKDRSSYSLSKSTLYKEKKMNLFFWQPRNV